MTAARAGTQRYLDFPEPAPAEAISGSELPEWYICDMEQFDHRPGGVIHAMVV
jgi:hypothetical protein